jgi:hypothetical protein
MAWQPDPAWLEVPGGIGPSTLGVWRAAIGDRAVVIKRLVPPDVYSDDALTDSRHFAYWRRAADVATFGLVDDTPGMHGTAAEAVEDADGITLISDWVEDAANSGLFVAMALGRFVGAELSHVRWLARDQLRDRLRRVEDHGGWPTLARTTVADVADTLWARREHFLALADQLPQVAQHGDPTPANMPGRDGDRLVAIDWSSLGYGPVGGDLGLYLLTAREELEPLLDAYLLGLPEGVATREQVTLGARISAVYTALTRAEWALARVAAGEGALASKFRHPAVAPHLRALQRQFPAIEALVES